MPNFDPAQVRAKADEIVRGNKTKVEDARELFLEEIMDWSDYYAEACSEQPTAPESKSTFDSIVNLWIQFSLFEISLHQFKKAVEVFEKAIVDPIGSKSSVIFQTYAKFCLDRKKNANAQNVYIKALCAGFSETENAVLWDEFVTMMRTVKSNKEFSVVDLYDAVKDQAGVDGKLAAPKEVTMLNDSIMSVDSSAETSSEDPVCSLDAIESKEADEEYHVHQAMPVPDRGNDGTPQEGLMVVEDGSNSSQGPSPTAHLANTSTEPVAANVRVKTESAQDPHEERLQEHAPRQQEERQYAAPDDLDEVTGLTPEQIIRIYSARPPMLFTALHKEPTSTGIAAFTAPAAGATTGTATAGEINPGAAELESFLGCKLASLPSSTPNMHKETLSFETWTTADKYLDLVEAMWAAQALKERHFDSWIMDMRNMHIEQEAALRDSHADINSSAPNAELKKKQQTEVLKFRNHCAVQQELLHALVNKALFTLLVEQQTQLAQIGFPRFSTAFVDKLKLYIQNRKKSNNNLHTIEYDAAVVQQVKAQQEILCAFLSVRLNTVSVERARAAQLARPRLSRAASMDQESDMNDPNYYDAEAKKLRKRRRIIAAHHNDSYSRSGVSSYAQYDSPGYSGGAGAAMEVDAPYYNNQGGGGYSQQYATKPYYDQDASYSRPRGGYQQDPYYNTAGAPGGRGAGRGRGARSDSHDRASSGAYPQSSYPQPRYSTGGRTAGGLYATVSGGRGRGRGRYSQQTVQVQALGGGGPRQSSFVGAAPRAAATQQVFDAPLQNTPDNPAVPLLQKLANLSSLVGKKK
eukprot:gene11342-13191_t